MRECLCFTHSTVHQIIQSNGEERSWWFVGRKAVDDITGSTVDVDRGYERTSYQYRVDIGDIDLSVAVVCSSIEGRAVKSCSPRSSVKPTLYPLPTITRDFRVL